METPAASFPSSSSTPAAPTPPPDGWAVPAGHGTAWWSSAWRLFTGAPGIWLVITILYIAIMIGLSIVPFLGQIAVSLLNPVFIGGIVLGCRVQDHGGTLKVSHLFAGFSEKAGPLIIVALLYFAGWIVVGCITLATAFIALGGGFLALLAAGDAVQMGSSLFDRHGALGAPGDRRGHALRAPTADGVLVRARAHRAARRRALGGDDDELPRLHAQCPAVPDLRAARTAVRRSSRASRSRSASWC